MKNSRIAFSILVSIIIMFFTQLSICQDNKNNLLMNQSNELWYEWNEYWEKNKEYPVQMSITPGSDETILNFSWYSKDNEKPSKLKVYKEDKKENLIYVSSVNLGNGFISNKSKIENLKENTTYYYSYTIDGKWTKKVAFKTKLSDKFTFVFMGDPQIGSSYKSKNLSSYEEGVKIDAYNWNKVMEIAMKKIDDCSFILCGGDETNTNNDYSNEYKEKMNEMEYCGFLCPRYLRCTPVVNTIGNHDKDNIDYYYHFNIPNQSKLGNTKAGGDYYFTYNNTLFLMLNTNNLNVEEHKKFIEDTINKNSNARWKIAVFHHDIYGCGIHSQDKDVTLLREKLPKVLEDNNINLVFNGHDHIYSRTYKLYNNRVIRNMTNSSKGIIYITGGSSTGSKFYKSSKENKEYIAKKYDEEIPIYTIVEISNNRININTYRVDNNEKIDNTIKLENKDG